LHALPVPTWPELDVLAYTGCVWLRALGLAFLQAEFRPGAALCYVWVDLFFVDGCADFASYFDLAAGVVDAVGNCGLGAIFIDDCGGLGEGVWVSVGIGNVISPVWAAIVSAELAMRSKNEEGCWLSRWWSGSFAA
jgi:hypothetical protein